MMTDRLTRPLPRVPAVTARDRDAAFAAVFAAHFEHVYRLLYRILGSRDAAEDLVQETFVRLHAHPEIVADPTALRPWLYRVATHLAYNARRDDARRVARQARAGRDDPSDAAVTGAAVDPLVQLQRSAEVSAVRRALDRLPPRQARLLLLRYAGLSYREVAAALEVAPSSVGTLLARAEAAFAAAYRSVDGPDGEEGTS